MSTRDSGSRKLAAVMFTDIKGFSKKMAENETAAFELLRTHDALMRVIASKFEGKVVKSIGDSFMVDFASAVNAVKAAIDAQKRFWTFNKGKSEFDKIEIRIGIHLGDVMVTEGDMFGDGVNIASRIEAITEPNRICISSDVYNQVKKKTDIKVFGMGEMRLKNIPEPIEVYEILIDSIPELSEPSVTARQAREQKPVIDADELEANEATSVEAAKKKGSAPVPVVHDTASQVEALYVKAEGLYNEGKIAEAEKIIEEIGKLDPSYHAAVEKKKEEDEKEKQVRDHYERAGGFIRDGKFDEAEEEVKKIFQLFPLHSGAQQLQLQIEDERYRKTEEERQKRLDEERKVRAEKDRQVDELIKRTEEEIEKGELAEARDSLQKICALDPAFTARERLEEKLRRAEAAQQERERQQAFLAEEKGRKELIAQNLERQQEREQTRVRRQQEEPAVGRKLNLKPVLWTAGGILAIVFLSWLYPHVKRTLFPVSASIVLQPLSNSSSSGVAEPLCSVLPRLLAQDLVRIERMTIVAPTQGDGSSGDYAKSAAAFRMKYVLHGSVAETESGFSITLGLFDAERHTDLFAKKFEGSYSSLNSTRKQIVQTILDATNVEGEPPTLAPPPSNAAAYKDYLEGLYYLGRAGADNLDAAYSAFANSAQADSSFGPAFAGQADVLLARCSLASRPEEETVQEATDLVRKALGFNPKDPVAYRELGEINLLSRRFDKVEAHIQTSLSYQPADARCYAVLAQLDLVRGGYDDALAFARKAKAILPDDAYIDIALGLAQQFDGRFGDAVNSFKESIALGLPDSLMTARYLINAWSAQESFTDLIQYYQNDLSRYPNDYRLIYWICRAYQMKPSVNDFKVWSDKGVALLSDYLFKHSSDARAHAYLGLFLSRQGKADDGEVEMKKAVSLAPNSSEILYREANMYAIQKKIPAAVSALKSALARDYELTEVLNPDFAVIRTDTAFVSAITQNVAAR